MQRRSTPLPPAHSALNHIADRWLKATCELFPETGSSLGFSKYEPLLSPNTSASHKAHIKLLEQTLESVEDLPASAFRGDAWLDRRAFLAKLRTELLFTRDLPRWRTNPQVHPDAAVQSLFDLIIRASGRLAHALPSLESRLQKIPAFLAAGAECLKKPVPLWSQLAVKSCAGAIEFLHSLHDEAAAVSPHPHKTKSLIQSCITAFADYAKSVDRISPGPAGSYAVGQSCFEFLLRERLGCDLTIREARRSGEYLIRQQEHVLSEEARKIGRKPARELLEEAAAGWEPPTSLLDHYRATTRQIKARLAAMDLVPLPAGESLRVLPVPPFLRHQFPTAAYHPPRPFSRTQSGIFWVNDLSLLEKDPARRLSEVRQHFGLELTSVHEAYPGHHLQFVMQFRHPSRIRRLCEHSIFYEGWTMWCEKLAVEQSLVEVPRAALIAAHDALWRAHRIVIDCGLQDGSLTPAAAARRLQKAVGFTASRARGDVNWYTSSPTVPMSYLLGRIEVEKLHRELVEGRGWSLRQFHDWILSQGSLPWSWIRTAGIPEPKSPARSTPRKPRKTRA